MDDAKFVLILFIFSIAFYVTMLTSIIEGAAVGILLAWGAYNDVQRDRLENRLKRYQKAFDKLIAEDCKEDGGNYDDR